MRRPPAGLCDACAHQKLIGNTRGSQFSLCLRSRESDVAQTRSASEPGPGETRYPKYPPVPVRRCPGYEPRR